MTELNKKFVLVTGVSELNIDDFIHDTKGKAQAELDNPTMVPAITNAAATKTKIEGIETMQQKHIALINEAKQVTKDIKAARKVVTKTVTDDWPPLVKAAIGEDAGKANLLGYKVKWIDGGHAADEPSVKNSHPMFLDVDYNIPGQHGLMVINSMSNTAALPWDGDHIALFETYDIANIGDPKKMIYLGIMKKSKFLNHIPEDETHEEIIYVAFYVNKDGSVEQSGSIKANVL
jgi:hypothetical protein